MPDGFLLMDKAGGWTSHDVVAKVRALTGTRKAGHSGTLDPMATGLLVLGLGRATRLLRFIQQLPKAYEAEARFGIATDSLDADGNEVERRPMSVGETEVAAALGGLRGSTLQKPPMVSAVKVGGQRLYQAARRGEEVARDERRVTVHDIHLTGFEDGEFPLVRFEVRCSSGTYVRVLADDAAGALGGRAHLTALRRIAIGELEVGSAHTIEEVAAATEEGRFEEIVLAPAEGLGHLPALELSPSDAGKVRHGAPVATPGGADRGAIRLMDHGRLLAVYGNDGSEELVPEVVLA